MKIDVPFEQHGPVTPLQAFEMPCNKPSAVIHRKKRQRSDLPNPTQLTKSESRTKVNHQSDPIANRKTRKHVGRKFRLPPSKAIDENIEKLNNLRDDRADIQKNIANLDQKLNAARKEYIAVSKENTRRCVGKGRS